MTEIQERLVALRDEKNADFVAKLCPSAPRETVLGIRQPELRRLAKELWKTEDLTPFMAELPHTYFEENLLHAFLLDQIRDYDVCNDALERLLPWVDSWCACDSINPPVFKKHRQELLEHIERWLASGETYTVRLGVKMLMNHFLDGDFRPEYLEQVAIIKTKEYYVNMMRAWYFATALAKQWESSLPYLTERRLDPWTHGKTIQKAVESYRIFEERKALLKELRQPRKAAAR